MKIAAALARAGIALTILASPPAQAAQTASVSDRSPDHVLVWTRDIDRVTALVAVKLGFQVRPGGDFGDGVANRLIRFANHSFLELLYFTRPEGELTGDVRSDYAATSGGTLATGFGLQVSDVDATARQLRERRWKLRPDSPMRFDPDGDGPLPAEDSMWRTVEFTAPPLRAAELFFIHYRDMALTSAQKATGEVFSRHPNGALRLSAVWLLTADPDDEASRLVRLGFERSESIDLPQLGVRGIRFSAGSGSILVLKPSGAGAAADALAARGPHLYGISVEVADLDLAQRIVERGYGLKSTRYPGVSGEAIAAPTHTELGFIVEFHRAALSVPLSGAAR